MKRDSWTLCPCEWIARWRVNLSFWKQIHLQQMLFGCSFKHYLLFVCLLHLMCMCSFRWPLPICPHLPCEFWKPFDSTEQGFRLGKDQISLVREFLSLPISTLMVLAVQSSISSRLVWFLFLRNKQTPVRVISRQTLLVIQDSEVTGSTDWQQRNQSQNFHKRCLCLASEKLMFICSQPTVLSFNQWCL